MAALHQAMRHVLSRSCSRFERSRVEPQRARQHVYEVEASTQAWTNALRSALWSVRLQPSAPTSTGAVCPRRAFLQGGGPRTLSDGLSTNALRRELSVSWPPPARSGPSFVSTSHLTREPFVCERIRRRSFRPNASGCARWRGAGARPASRHSPPLVSAPPRAPFDARAPPGPPPAARPPRPPRRRSCAASPPSAARPPTCRITPSNERARNERETSEKRARNKRATSNNSFRWGGVRTLAVTGTGGPVQNTLQTK
eukprot:1180528-Prorocentrum_minimum.AAC.4